MSFILHAIAMIRAYYQVTLEKFIEHLSEKVLQEFEKLLHIFKDETIGSLDMAQFYDSILIPSTRSGASAERRKAAQGIIKIMTKRFSYQRFIHEFKVAGHIPLTRTYHSYSKDELSAFELNNTYFTATAAERRRRQASRIVGYAPFAGQVPTSLRSLIPDIISENDANKFAFALCCLPPSIYSTKGFTFLHDGNLTEDSKTYIKDAIDYFHTAEDTFKGAHLFVDITNDVRDETLIAHDLLLAFFSDTRET